MEQERFLACGESQSSSGSHTLSEGEEEITAVMDVNAPGDGEDGHNSTEVEEEEEEESEDEDEKVNTT